MDPGHGISTWRKASSYTPGMTLILQSVYTVSGHMRLVGVVIFLLLEALPTTCNHADHFVVRPTTPPMAAASTQEH